MKMRRIIAMPKIIETAICENCEEDVEYKLGKIKKKLMMRGIEIEVELYRGFCNQCGHEVYPAKYDKINYLIAHDEYKKKVGLLTSEDIIRMRKKRGMSQRDLANFIQCGEKNIARYERGAIQDRVFDYLIRLVDDDEAYEQMKKLNKSISFKPAQ